MWNIKNCFIGGYMKTVSLIFEGITIIDATLRRSTISSFNNVEVLHYEHYVGLLTVDTHKLRYIKYLPHPTYKVERR